MLNEEALILLAVLFAFALLALGVWEQISPARRRFPERQLPQPPAPSIGEWATLAPAEPGSEGSPTTVPSALVASTPGRAPRGHEGPFAPPERTEAPPGVGLDTFRENDDIEDRRLWRSYTNLGLRHLDAGNLEAALEPLLHALNIRVAPERLLETRVALVRAFEGVVEQRSQTVRRLLEAGETHLADVEIEMTWSLLKAGIDRGMPQDDVRELLARVQRLVEDLGHHRA